MPRGMSDRRTVELVVLPALLAALMRSVYQGLGEVDGAPLLAIIDLLDQAIKEPLEGMDAVRRTKLSRRSMRATTAGLSAICGEHSCAVQWLAVARFIIRLTEAEVIAVAEGSVFCRAWDAMIAVGFGSVSEEDEGLAERLADVLAAALGREGLFV